MGEASAIEWVYGGAGFVIGLLVAGIFLFARLTRLERRNAELTAEIKSEKAALDRAGAALDLRFKATAQEILTQNSEQFLTRAQERLKDVQKDTAHDLEKRHKAIADLVDPVNKALKTMDEKLQNLETVRVTAYTELQTHLKSMTIDQVKLRQETATLVQALRSPSTRGQWGEMQLRRCLEMAGMQRGVHFEEQESANNGQRPDVIIKLSGGQSIIIDSKTPLEGFLDALKEGATEEERNAALDRHARHVKTHIRQLGSKAYWSQFETPEFVVMFLPGESYFSAALERDPGLIEAGAAEKVMLATPTSLIALLKAVMYGWNQEKLAQNVRAISALGNELHDRISVFAGHMEKVGRGLGGAMDAYNKAVSSLESRVLTSARRFRDLNAASGDDIGFIDTIDHAIKPLSAPESASSEEPEKKRA